MWQNINMANKIISTVIEPEIIDEHGNSLSADAARAKPTYGYRRAGVLTGFFALACSVVMLLAMAVFTCLLVIPLLLLGRLLSVKK